VEPPPADDPDRWDDESGEADLIARVRKGELAAFNQLVERHQTTVYNLCLRMLGSQQPAEDTTQEAFISAYRHIDKFRGGKFRSWLLRIAANACYDELRRRKSRPATSLDEPQGQDDRHIDPPDNAPSMEEHAEQMELRGALQAALARLPDDQRLALILCDVQGYDYAEIAVIMQSTLGTVKSRINRARSKMRTLMLERRELLPSRLRHTGEDK
jgi:RNA polymerase sigma factor (sigma-70 family)